MLGGAGKSITDSNGKPVKDHVCVAAIVASTGWLEHISLTGQISFEASAVSVSKRAVTLKSYLSLRIYFNAFNIVNWKRMHTSTGSL